MQQIFFVIAVSLLLSACASTGSSKLGKDKSVKASEINTELGAAYLGQGEYARANEKLEKALNQDPKNAEAHNIYALLKMRLKQFDKAESSFKKALKLEPKNSSILNNYGTFLCNQGDFKKALKMFSFALQDPLYPTPEFAYTNTGICMMKEKQYDKAESYFRTALKRNSKYPVALYQMAILNEKRKQYPLAWSYLQRYYKLGAAKNPENLWTAVRLSRYLGNRSNEAKYSSQLKNRFPDSAQTARMMKRYR